MANRPRKGGGSSRASGSKNGSLLSKMAGSPELMGTEQTDALALAEGPNGPLSKQPGTMQMYKEPTTWQRLVNPQGVQQAQNQQAQFVGQQVLSKQAADQAYQQALALQASNQDFLKLQGDVNFQHSLKLANFNKQAAIEDKLRGNKQAGEIASDARINENAYKIATEERARKIAESDRMRGLTEGGTAIYNVLGKDAPGAMNILGSVQTSGFTPQQLAQLQQATLFAGGADMLQRGGATLPTDFALRNVKNLQDTQLANDPRVTEARAAKQMGEGFIKLSPGEAAFPLSKTQPGFTGSSRNQFYGSHNVAGMPVQDTHPTIVENPATVTPSEQSVEAAVAAIRAKIAAAAALGRATDTGLSPAEASTEDVKVPMRPKNIVSKTEEAPYAPYKGSLPDIIEMISKFRTATTPVLRPSPYGF